MEKNWYEPNTQQEPSGWYTPAPVLPAPAAGRRRNGWRAAAIVLGIVLLLIASSLLFGREKGEEGISHSGGSDNGFAFDWSFGQGQEDDGEDDGESGFSDSFRDFFENYYTSYKTAEECLIPRAEAPRDLNIALCEPHGEALTWQEIYERCSPFIVAISAYPSADSELRYSWGTGIILSQDGYIVTNSHVVEGTCRAKVTLQDDREFDAKLVGNDSRSDIAVLKIEAVGLPAAEFGQSDTLLVGDAVAALGNPLGNSFRCTMTDGIITGIGRDISYNGATLTLLQTNAAINEGNSGGALINAYGQVIGITNMKMSNTYAGSVTIEGVGFAIPSDTVKAMADALLSDGAVLGRPALGITVGAIPPEAAEHYSLPDGLYVSAISDGSDCKAKGLQVGDVITRANDTSLTVTADLVNLIADMEVGDTLALTVYRDGETFSVTVALVDMNSVY